MGIRSKLRIPRATLLEEPAARACQASATIPDAVHRLGMAVIAVTRLSNGNTGQKRKSEREVLERLHWTAPFKSVCQKALIRASSSLIVDFAEA